MSRALDADEHLLVAGVGLIVLMALVIGLTMLALDASSGQTLWTYAAGSSVNAGASIVDGVVYWGSGYAHLGIPGFTTNNKFFAFSKNGQ